MDIRWYLVVSAFVFSIGATGVLTRRNPLVILLCLELMLNAANLALIAFARMWGNGDGQIFAIIVMVVPSKFLFAVFSSSVAAPIAHQTDARAGGRV